MKVLIIGGVAAGTKTAAKLKREDRDLDVTILTKSRDISYAGCGLPYYVGGLIEAEDELVVNTPAQYSALTGVQVFTGREAIAVDPAAKSVTVRKVDTGEMETHTYDKLVIAAGASPIVPDIEGSKQAGVFTLRTPQDAVALRSWIQERGAKRAVVVGGGFIGLETAENLHKQGLSVTVIDVAPQVLPGVLDPEMAVYVKKHLLNNGVHVRTSTKADRLAGTGTVTGVHTSVGLLPADVVVLSIGIQPNTVFLEGTGIEMVKGAIVTDRCMATSLPDIYAAGDCALVRNRITGTPQHSPMGSSANLEGRTLAQVLTGSDKVYQGVLGTGVVRLPGLSCGRTGLTEAAARAAGYDVVSVLVVTDDKAHYYPGAAFFATKLVADRATHRLLGMQVLGPGAVDKMVDIAVMAISMNAVLEDFENVDFAYAPPFSTAIHPLVQAVYVLENKLNGSLVSMTPAEYAAGRAEDYRVVDVSSTPSVRGAVYVDLAAVNGPIEGLAKDEKLLLVCTRGKRAYFLQNRLRHYGYTNTVVLEGSTFFNDVRTQGAMPAITPEEITKVKALGFLLDKRTADRFNGRVITRNGKITAAENRAVAEAAELFGTGEITMTSRMTLEIQGVPYENIEPLRTYLAQAGLETGGTGSKVRPVVSCKGTTCQYGLIDTFALSEEIHERFYHGYSNVKLPHKFKIAVGGCPNNCVKPDLNDLGIIGQRMPVVDMDKCRGCKVCQIEAACPIHAAKMENGKIAVALNACNNCGRCLGKCPFNVFREYTNGYRVYIGGR